jgi:aspartate/methionine/tyrosine aminotransferase
VGGAAGGRHPLTAADPDFPVCAEIIDALQRHLAAGYLSYGPAEGLPELRRVATDTLRHRHGLPCDPDTLFPTDGAASALFLVARLALPVAGDEAIIPDPVDFLLDRSVRAAGGVVRRWPTPGGRYDATQLEALVTPRTRLISLCNPHNPLGRVLRRDELEAIADVALRHDLWILSDEVWSDIVYAPHSHVSMAALHPDVAGRTFTVFGFSKSYGLAGMRLGLLAAPDAVQRRRIMTLAHAEDTAYGASTISQVAGACAYELGDGWLARFVAHLRRRRDQTVAGLTAIPNVRCAVPEGTFVAFADVSRLGIDQDDLAGRLLERHDVAVVPGSSAFFGPGAAGHLRVSFATSREILAEGLDRIAAGLRPDDRERDGAARPA